ncbi:MAG: DUF523 and DUF1722 domain-containing protein [Thermodesulfobacteriota bacterium]|nr:DUF523 and DUF1722 domain-containing protein [Thermodesulfobacteriota bacterium]
MDKPVVVVSKCLGFDHCRYNGQVIPDGFVEKLSAYVDMKPVCPEMAIGLGVPRDPVRISLEDGQSRMHQPATGKDFTDAMQQFTHEFLTALPVVDGFIMKSRSPSCGIRDTKIFHHKDRPDTGTDRGGGLFGGQLKERFPGAAIEDEGRLKNFTIREHFLAHLFARVRFREARQAGKISALMDFHSRYKYLFLAYNEQAMRICGKITANHDHLSLETVFDRYEAGLADIFAAPARPTALINMVMHAFGIISDNLSSEEKRFFLNTLENYRDERIPLATLTHLLHSYAVRFDTPYLKNQAFLQPYPPDLVEITDSGKGRNR